ncbi:hypothetical protein A6A29_33255 [Streptomyces sp. TSRI0281]|nr:hypothetical protein [Streptomyces sp. TSRI0281]OKI44912.1 hypothetical protein A6A29_33255 [Streptomyces sp. TSRI0281]
MDQNPEQITLGDVTVSRIKEFFGSSEMSPAQFFPDSPHGSWDEHRDWLAPDFWNPRSCFCEDPAESRATRHKLLGRAAENSALVFPAHFGGQGAAEVARSGSKFAIKEWAGFPRLS